MGILLSLGGQWFYESEIVQTKGFFYGFDSIVWLLILMQSGGGLLVAVVVKYSNQLLKVCISILIYSLSSLKSVIVIDWINPSGHQCSPCVPLCHARDYLTIFIIPLVFVALSLKSFAIFRMDSTVAWALFIRDFDWFFFPE